MQTSLYPSEFIGTSRMRGVYTVGSLGIVDAAVVRFLTDLRERYGTVCAAPSRAVFEPEVSLDDLRYVLGQLRCVDQVAREELAGEMPVVSFPQEFIERANTVLTTAIDPAEALPEAPTIADLERQRPDPLILLTGCFDLIHAGHVRLIEQAAQIGARPVVAAMTSHGIRVQPKNVAGDRPFWSMADRFTVLSELRSNPIVAFFDGPDCLQLIDRLRPDVWVKEERDRGRPIVEQETALARRLGARIVWLRDGAQAVSSTAVARRVLATTARTAT